MINFKENAGLFNDSFTMPVFPYNALSTVEFSTNDIFKIIRNLNPNKAHGQDKWSTIEDL